MNKTLLLMRKELVYLVKGLKSNLIMGGVFAILFPIVIPSMALSGIIIIPYLLIYAVLAHEEKNNGDILNITLPVERKDICAAKYVLGMLYAIVTAFLLSFSLLIPASQGDTLAGLFIGMGLGNMILLATSIGMMYIAIIIPIVYKFGTIKVRYYMFILYILLFAGGTALSGILEELGMGGMLGRVQSKVEDIAFILLIGLSLLIYFLSYSISVKIYKGKEFR